MGTGQSRITGCGSPLRSVRNMSSVSCGLRSFDRLGMLLISTAMVSMVAEGFLWWMGTVVFYL
ncbi:hypothetical protein Hanom_Chr09g00785681 [Helianthus anomalus]